MSNREWPISISKSNCDDCFKCVRECEVKAITFDHTQPQPQVDSKQCIACGHCIELCPTNVITLDSHVDRVRRAIKNNSTIIASLAPNWVTEFVDIEPNRMIEALRLIGFTHVSETSIGVSLVKQETARIMSTSSEFLISNSCPAVTKMIKTTHPSLVKYIINTVHPTIAHARYLKKIYGDDTIVVAIDSCTATKTYTTHSNSDLYAALTFEELRNLMVEEGIRFDLIPGNDSYVFEPFEATDDNMYVVPRGVYNHNFLAEFKLSQSTIYNYSGINRIQNILNSLENEEKPKNSYIELWSCKGGCLYGAGIIDSRNIITKRIKMSRYEMETKPYRKDQLPSVDLRYIHKSAPTGRYVSQEEINSALESLYMEHGDEPTNCGGCGYDTCESFAEALALGKTRHDMCLYYQKQLAQSKFTILINKMQSGVAVVGSDMRIIEANKSLAMMMGADSEMIFDTNPGMTGLDIFRLFTSNKYVTEVLKNPELVLTKDIQVKDKILNLVVFSLQKGKIACIIIRNLFSRNTGSNEIASRTQKVINDNLATVQQIAYLLGENASRTEAILNSIVESQKIIDER